MINRENSLVVKAFLRYEAEVYQREPETVELLWFWLKHVLRWADARPLSDAPQIRPVFPRYIADRRSRGGTLHPKGVKRACTDARMLFRWLHEQQPNTYAALNDVWVNTLQPPRMPERLPAPLEYVTLEEVRKLVKVPVPDGDLALWRDKAAAAFLFLSGMRATAFCTLPLRCVSIDERRVRQLPTEGVRTKNKRAAITSLLAIEDLLSAAKAWDSFVREQLPETAPWYAVVLAPFGVQSLAPNPPGAYRVNKLNVRLRHLFQLAELRHKSAHCFRRGHAVYGIEHAATFADFKAMSQNLMHTTVAVTDAHYAVLSDSKVRVRLGLL